MGLETGNTIADLNANWPLGSDPKAQGDDHIRLIKKILKADVLSLSEGGTIDSNLTVDGVLSVNKIGGNPNPLDIGGSPVVNLDQSVNWPALGVRGGTDTATGASLMLGRGNAAADNWLISWRGDPDDELDFRWQNLSKMQLSTDGHMVIAGDLAVVGGDAVIGALTLNGTGTNSVLSNNSTGLFVIQADGSTWTHRFDRDGGAAFPASVLTKATADGRYAQLGGDTSLVGNLTVGGTLGVTGAATVGGTLTAPRYRCISGTATNVAFGENDNTGIHFAGGTPSTEMRVAIGGANIAEFNGSGIVAVTGTFQGSGAGLTNLDAGTLTSGTVPDARLSGTYTGISIDDAGGSVTTGAVSATSVTSTGQVVGTSFRVGINGSETNVQFRVGSGDQQTGMYGFGATTAVVFAKQGVEVARMTGDVGNPLSVVTRGLGDARYAQLNTATGAGATDLPVGSTVLMFAGGDAYDRNATVAVCLSSGGTAGYVDANDGSAGAALAGTWRARGQINTGGPTYTYLVQRVS